jgi:predicted house-cleaning noncanonical NTP pyrophosphatase (MazG superfamily)
MGQKAMYRSLTREDHIMALKQKIVEEAKEIPLNGRVEDIVSELADLQQAFDDLKLISGITDVQIAISQTAKFDKKGGFLSGSYVETIELQDDDPWLPYYRDNPDLFPEVPGR